jgi:predicted DCC family thiol-disulfide oxidoreductase YuxK
LSNWKPQPAGELPDGLILFDGVCVLCSGWVHFILPRDQAGHFRFVAIQTEAGASLATRFGIEAGDPQTIVVTRNGQVHFKADAPLAIWQDLPGWRWTAVFRLFPRAMRNFLYDCVARNRYRIFGKRDTCLVPTSHIRSRFISTLRDLTVPPRASAA